ncbi:hypothetical protein [Methylobacterium brachythecii]|uniref:Uncharacterized protein n=1 Tax=Methylobacterium brachythecii TaxID=1176177 RepID=A0A7W6F9E2_9HYPH|nr:hypothetical protein [Methylobacterium brachythecii]MBB3905422.1 hypothetical protein [Methylobacterium brachythecii]GLS44902.1 hypothetical protein GCM10007884_28910 [Methylobacterium brachythecii]
MVSFLRAAVLTAGLLPIVSALPAAAAQREPFEMVKGWEVERTVGDTSPNPCLISKTYKDKEDHNLVNGIVFSLEGSNVALAFVYQGWEWDKGDAVKASLLAGKKVLRKQASWNADAQVLAAGFPNSIVPDLLATETLYLKFEDGDADFDITGFPQAYESLRRCDATPGKAAAPSAAAPVAPGISAATAAKAPPAPAATPATSPVVPPQARIQAYILGVMLQQVVKECEVSTSGKQRSALDTKIDGMKTEMAALDSTVREQVAKRPEPHCPPAQDEPKFQATLADFLANSPEDFSALMEKRGAEEAAKAQAKTEAPKTEAPKTETPKP